MNSKLVVTILGSGTSCGVPLIGCSCPVCTSTDPHDRRMRAGVNVSYQGYSFQIDFSPDFREQAIRFRVPRIDAALVTHCHADHVLGLDDIRRYNTIQDETIPLYSRPFVFKGIERIFGYIVKPPKMAAKYTMYRPQVAFHTIGDKPIAMGPFTVRTLRVPHGPVSSTAVELALADGRRVVVATDCDRVTPKLAQMMRGASCVLLDGLRDRPHPSHLTIDECIAALVASGTPHGRLIHIGHDISHVDIRKRCPKGIAPAYDGERIEL